MIKVLIAEDIDILRNNIVKQLEKQEDIKVVDAVATGKDAIAAANAHSPDIAVLDMEMEETNSGCIASRVIVQNNPDIKIIILTVHEEEQMISSAFESGIVDYVIKEANCDNLIKHIRNAYNNDISLDSQAGKVVHEEFLRLSKWKKDIGSFYQTFLSLTITEREILSLLYDGYKIREIADMRHVEQITIKRQVGSMLKKFGVNRTKQIIEQIKEIGAEELIGK